MATRTRYRGYTRPSRLDPARIEDSVGVPLDDIDRDVQGITDANSAGWRAVGVSADGVVRRGKSVNAAEESYAGTSYGLMPTPDRVTGVALPADGLIFIAFKGMWRETTNRGRAAIFLNEHHLTISNGWLTPILQEAEAISPGFYAVIATTPFGLKSSGASAGSETETTTGEIVGASVTDVGSCGGVLPVFAAAGTYDVSVRVKAGSGDPILMKSRKLWVWTMAF